MVYNNYKHIDPNDFHGKELTLHDCIADKILFEDNNLYFYFANGFWITPHHNKNTIGKIVRTDASCVSFSTIDINKITVCVFTSNTLFRSTKTRMENWHIEQLIAAVNSQKCTIEFITQYRTHCEQMWHCVIHSKKKPYYRECQLYLPETEATFFWNDLLPNYEW